MPAIGDPETGNGFETILFDVDESRVATLILNRPNRLNAFNRLMAEEVRRVWARVRGDDTIHAVVIAARGEKAFCAGMDMTEEPWLARDTVWNQVDPGAFISPKRNRVWKPVLCATQGIVCGGAFYFLCDADIVVCASNAQFFLPQLSLGMPAAVEPVMLMSRVGYAEAARICLMAGEERLSAQTALRIGLVNEVVPPQDLLAHAKELATVIAGRDTALAQAAIRAMWEAREPLQGAAIANAFKIGQISAATLGAQAAPRRPGANWKER